MSREIRKPPTSAKPDAIPVARREEEEVTFNHTGRVTHDDRGNAVWEWAGKESGGLEPTQPLKKLDNPTLSLADETPLSPGDGISNPLGTLKGYSPYDSGVLDRGEHDRNEAPRKKDLRRLSEWMKLKKSVEKAKSGAG